MHAISLADLAFTKTLSWAADGLNPRLRLQAELERLRREICLLREEIRLKDARMEQIVPHRRPYYPPTARLAILELRAARGWSLAQTARIFLVSPLTVASWTGRLDEKGPDALVRLPVPVNRFPDFVGYLARRLRLIFDSLVRFQSRGPSETRVIVGSGLSSRSKCSANNRQAPSSFLLSLPRRRVSCRHVRPAEA